MDQIVPYLNFAGSCEEALNFYKDVFNGEIENIMRYDGAPMDVPEDHKNKIMHSHFKAGDLTFMASDAMHGKPPTVGNNISLSLNFNSEEDQKKVFDKLSDGGTITMPLGDTFWGAVFGMCIDKYGINWMFNHDKPQS
jgi:PhnB protein